MVLTGGTDSVREQLGPENGRRGMIENMDYRNER